MTTEALFISVVPNMRFSPGQLICTAGVDELVQQGQLNPGMYLRRHLGGDWGDLSEGDRELNDAALASGQDRLFAAYQVAPRAEAHTSEHQSPMRISYALFCLQ